MQCNELSPTWVTHHSREAMHKDYLTAKSERSPFAWFERLLQAKGKVNSCSGIRRNGIISLGKGTLSILSELREL